VKKERPPDLDVAIAEKVMGWEWWKSSATGRRGIFAPNAIPRFTDEWFTVRADGTEELCMDWGYSLPAYSTDIAAAFTVVDKLQGGLRFELRRRPDGGYWASFGEEMSAEAETAAMAICLAALAAVEEKN
jgi:hypothetical protein